jgi:hypothetical protein
MDVFDVLIGFARFVAGRKGDGCQVVIAGVIDIARIGGNLRKKAVAVAIVVAVDILGIAIVKRKKAVVVAVNVDAVVFVVVDVVDVGRKKAVVVADRRSCVSGGLSKRSRLDVRAKGVVVYVLASAVSHWEMVVAARSVKLRGVGVVVVVGFKGEGEGGGARLVSREGI